MKLKLYSDQTPNGWKVEIILSELKVDYEYYHVDIGMGEQFNKDFLSISPNNKIPAIIDPQGPAGKKFSLFESGAILIYLAEKYNSNMFPNNPRLRYETLAWLMFQMGGIGPFLGQAHHFTRYVSQKIPYAIDRYVKEASRLYQVMDNRLAEHDYLAAERYTIADIACFPWIFSHRWQKQNLLSYSNLHRWYKKVQQRAAVQKVFANIPERVMED